MKVEKSCSYIMSVIPASLSQFCYFFLSPPPPRGKRSRRSCQCPSPLRGSPWCRKGPPSHVLRRPPQGTAWRRALDSPGPSPSLQGTLELKKPGVSYTYILKKPHRLLVFLYSTFPVSIRKYDLVVTMARRWCPLSCRQIRRKPLVYVLDVPNHMTYADFCQFCGSFIQHVLEMRVVR